MIIFTRSSPIDVIYLTRTLFYLVKKIFKWCSLKFKRIFLEIDLYVSIFSNAVSLTPFFLFLYGINKVFSNDFNIFFETLS